LDKTYKEKMLDIENNIVNTIKETDDNGSTRYKSWEHCYKYFSKDKQQIDIKIACLNLAFYLASWGMYRGSSFLLQQDYFIHKSVINKIIDQKKYFQNIDFLKINDQNKNDFAEKIENLINEIKQSYGNNNVSDTLASKIILGMFGCIPAYDQNFINGLKKHFKNNKNDYNGLLTINKKSLIFLFEFYKNNKNQFNNAEKIIQKMTGLKYPAMKLVDMYFWSIGYKYTSKS